MNQLHPVFQQALAPYLITRRQELSRCEKDLLLALQLMKDWVIRYAEPCASGTPAYPALQRDLAIANQAIQDATTGQES